MGIESICICFGDERPFYPGEMLSGYCNIVVVDEPVEIGCVTVKVNGVAKVSWAETFTATDSSGMHAQVHTIWYINSLDLIATQQKLIIQDGFLLPGRHSLPFAFQLKSDLASSFEGTYGNIRYSVEAITDCHVEAGTKLPKCMIPFKISKPVNRNQTSDYSLPVKGNASQTLCYCFTLEGETNAEVRTDKTAYCAGEVIELTGVFENGSKRKVKPYAKLVQRQTILAHGRTRKHCLSWQLTPIDDRDPDSPPVVNSSIKSHASLSWSGVKFRLPNVPPSTACPILQVDYYIEVGLAIPRAADLKIYLPIVVGIVANEKEPMNLDLMKTVPASPSSSPSLSKPTTSRRGGTEHNNSNQQIIVQSPPSYSETISAFNRQRSPTSFLLLDDNTDDDDLQCS